MRVFGPTVWGPNGELYELMEEDGAVRPFMRRCFGGDMRWHPVPPGTKLTVAATWPASHSPANPCPIANCATCAPAAIGAPPPSGDPFHGYGFPLPTSAPPKPCDHPLFADLVDFCVRHRVGKSHQEFVERLLERFDVTRR